MAQKRPKDWVFLYVPDDEIEEAMHLGAVRQEGEARLTIPSPLPPGATLKSFDRWRTTEAKFRWCLRLVTGVLSDMVPTKASATGPDVTKAPGYLPELLAEIGKGAAPADRVYLYATAETAGNLRNQEGVCWDRRRRMYYATKGADLKSLFSYLTPSAYHAWLGERAAIRTTDWLVQEMAMAEFARRNAPKSGSNTPIVKEAAIPAKGISGPER